MAATASRFAEAVASRATSQREGPDVSRISPGDRTRIVTYRPRRTLVRFGASGVRWLGAGELWRHECFDGVFWSQPAGEQSEDMHFSLFSGFTGDSVELCLLKPGIRVPGPWVLPLPLGRAQE